MPELLPVCTVEGCLKPRDRRARLCHMHQARKKRHGDVNYVTPSIKDPGPRFWAKVDKSGGCWLWLGWKCRDGYGMFRSGPRRTTAHRWAWVLSGRGEIPAGMHLDHLCRVRACVNPDHLEVVTPRENMARGINQVAPLVRRKQARARNAACQSCPFAACDGCAYQPEETR